MSIELLAIVVMAIILGGIMLMSCYGLRLELREWSAELRGAKWERDQMLRYADPSE